MIDELYVLARLRELSRECAQIAAERKARATLSATASPAIAPAATRAPVCGAKAPLATV